MSNIRRQIIVAVLAMALFMMMFAAAPVLAKTRTEVYVEQTGGVSPALAEKDLITPNERIRLLWGVDGTGSATLKQSDKVTAIDTFATSSEINLKAKDYTLLGFVSGKLVLHLKMLWESNKYEDSGFAGVAQWRAVDETPHVVTVSAVYHGYGFYEGQLLQLEGILEAPPPLQVLEGSLLG